MGWGGVVINHGYISSSGRRIVRGKGASLNFYDEGRFSSYDEDLYGVGLW